MVWTAIDSEATYLTLLRVRVGPTQDSLRCGTLKKERRLALIPVILRHTSDAAWTATNSETTHLTLYSVQVGRTRNRLRRGALKEERRLPLVHVILRHTSDVG
jgi:hypothetical protein